MYICVCVYTHAGILDYEGLRRVAGSSRGLSSSTLISAASEMVMLAAFAVRFVACEP